jgi:hypothetical protein
MDDNEVRRLLKQLHGALEDRSTITEKDRELLRQLLVDIQALLGQPREPGGAAHQGTLDQLQRAVTRFEVSHPDLTATLAQVSKALGDMGI